MATYHYVARFQLEGKTVELKDSSNRGDIIAAVIDRNYKTGKIIVASRHNSSRVAEDTCAERKQIAVAWMVFDPKTIEILQGYLEASESRFVAALEKEQAAQSVGTITGNASFIQYQRRNIATQKVELARVKNIINYQAAVNN